MTCSRETYQLLTEIFGADHMDANPKSEKCAAPSMISEAQEGDGQ